jgi:hypothetical protein
MAISYSLALTRPVPAEQVARELHAVGVVRLVSGLFERVPGDAVPHREFEDIWLLRRGGELTLNEQDDLWPPHRQAALSQPYRRATHTFADS